MPQVSNHAPVTVALIVSSITAIVLGVARDKYGLDLSGYEPHIQVLATAAGYFITGQKVVP
jgi:hypothetical protein